jgi:hypothetical protein
LTRALLVNKTTAPIDEPASECYDFCMEEFSRW